MWDSVLEEWQKTRGDLLPPQPNMVSLGLGSVAALLQHPKLQQNKPPVCQLTVYTEHFFSAELVPILPNNTKCHLFGTWCIQPSSLLHYAFNCGACQSWKVWGDFSYQTHASRCVFPPHGLKLLRWSVCWTTSQLVLCLFCYDLKQPVVMQHQNNSMTGPLAFWKKLWSWKYCVRI